MTFDLGRILPVFTGTYLANRNYVPLDVVYYNGSSYVCKSSCTGMNPSTAVSHWQIIAAGGELTGQLSSSQQQAILNELNASGAVIDNNYIHTSNDFTDAHRQLLEQVGRTEANVLVNGASIGTVRADMDTELNITVPTRVEDLTDANLFKKKTEFKYADEYLPEIVNGCTYIIETPVYGLTIDSLKGVDRDDFSTWDFEASVMFKTGAETAPCDFPPQIYKDGSTELEPNAMYRIDFVGYTMKINKFKI